MSENEIEDGVCQILASPNFKLDGLCFAARSTGLYHSEDGGKTWQDTLARVKFVKKPAVTSMAFSPDFTKDHTIFAGVSGAVLRSMDIGKNWLVAPLPAPAPIISALVASPNYSADATIFIGTLDDGVLLSADGGTHWYPWNFGLIDLRVTCMAVSPRFAQDEMVLVGTETGLFRSANGGRSWKETGFPGHEEILSLAISPDFSIEPSLFAGTTSGLYHSIDQGNTWSSLSRDALPGEVSAILLGENPTDILVLSNGALFISHDRGENWDLRRSSLADDTCIVFVATLPGFDPENRLIVATQEGNVMEI